MFIASGRTVTSLSIVTWIHFMNSYSCSFDVKLQVLPLFHLMFILLELLQLLKVISSDLCIVTFFWNPTKLRFYVFSSPNSAKASSDRHFSEPDDGPADKKRSIPCLLELVDLNAS